MALAAEGDGPVVTLALSDGQSLHVRLLARSESTVIVELLDGQRLTLPASAVVSIREGAAVTANPPPGWTEDPNKSRYLYSPSAHGIGAGKGYLAQRALAITSVGVGITDFWDLEAGTIVPLLFTEAPMGVVGTKLHGRVTEKLRAGVGAQGFFVSDAQLGFVFANLSYGDVDRHGSVAGGVLMNFEDGDIGADIVTTSLNWRLGERSALIGEVWWTYWPGGSPWPRSYWFVVPAGGVRLFGPKFAVDLGLVPIITGEASVPLVPVPWVSFAWNWSLRKE
jgi:hypothetical protein